ncbi:MAG: hypothetical protein HY080_12110 [Gammaproteobacteria bacterium]|nr:hypothetical protein [Gammaproteobacteria bacterium]
MLWADAFLIVSNPYVSGFIWLVMLVVILYFARTPARAVITALSRTLHNGLRLSARGMLRGERWLMERNREVLLAQGREASERIIEREFDRIDASVRRDMSAYPGLHRHLSEDITQLEEDYKQSADVPPEPPAWYKAVDAVAKLPGKDPMVVNILEDIHESMIKANNTAIVEYRKASHSRHEHLKKMLPRWRKVQQVLEQVDKNAKSLLSRAQTIDRYMDEYENTVRKTSRAERMLSSSSLTQFFIALFVLSVAGGGAVINFELIALPMSEMVQQKTEIMGIETYRIAALVIILLEIAVGIFVMELLRVTRLFPVIGALNDKMRVRLTWAAFVFLTTLACVEAGLAWMRDWLIIDTKSVELGADAFKNQQTWIITAAQMGLGWVLPYILMFVAIPLESFIHSLRTVLGVAGIVILRSLAWLFRIIGNVVRFAGKALLHLYDFIIFLPLWVESLFKPGDELETGDHTSTI